MCGDVSNPLLVLPLQTNSDKPDGFSVPFAEANDEPMVSKIAGAGFSDYEASILKKLQQVNYSLQSYLSNWIPSSHLTPGPYKYFMRHQTEQRKPVKKFWYVVQCDI